MTTTQKAVNAYIAIAGLMLEAIQEAGVDGIPSGHLYAIVMQYMNLDQYNMIINSLVKAGKITNKGHLLKAT